MRVTLIYNPKAGDDEHPSVDEVLASIRAAGHAVTCQSSEGDAWESALEDPGDLVAVAGGDGTIGAVAGRLFGRRIPIAVLPHGTANNVSRMLGPADAPVERLIADWASARRMGFDAGVVHGPWGATRFIEGVGVGLLARAISERDARDDVAIIRLDNREGRKTAGQRRLHELLGSYPAKDLKITLDGRDLSGEYILAEVMNIQHIGPGLHLAPEADASDGLLDVVLFTADERHKLGEHLANRLEGIPEPLQWIVPRGKRLELQWDGADLHIDDKSFSGPGSSPPRSPMVVGVNVDHHALQFLV